MKVLVLQDTCNSADARFGGLYASRRVIAAFRPTGAVNLLSLFFYRRGTWQRKRPQLFESRLFIEAGLTGRAGVARAELQRRHPRSRRPQLQRQLRSTTTTVQQVPKWQSSSQRKQRQRSKLDSQVCKSENVLIIVRQSWRKTDCCPRHHIKDFQHDTLQHAVCTCKPSHRWTSGQVRPSPRKTKPLWCLHGGVGDDAASPRAHRNKMQKPPPRCDGASAPLYLQVARRHQIDTFARQRACPFSG